MTKARDIASASPAPSTVSATELGYLDGVSSAIQTQIDSKIGSASAINPTIVDAKGDIIAATAADTVARLAVGSNDQVLTADSSTATGLKWATPASGSTFVGVKVTANADQSIANETATDVTWNTEEYDTDAFHSTSTNTNRLTVPSGKAGYYKIFFCVKFTNSANATGRRIISLQLNGTEIADYETHALSGVFPTLVCSITKYLEVADYVSLQAYQGSGASLDLRKNASPGSFGMEKIG